MPIWGALIGALGSIYASRKASKAQQKAADTQSQLGREYLGMARPYVQAGTGFAIPALQRVISQYLMPKLGQESPLLASQYRQQVSDIGRQERRGLSASRQYWRASGNIGRGRGESLRIGAMATRSRNLAALGFGEAQERYKEGTTGAVTSALGSVAGLGASALGAAGQATGMLAGAAGAKGAAVSQFWGDVAGALGAGIGSYEEEQQRQEDRDWFEDMLERYGLGGGQDLGHGLYPVE